MVVALNIYRRGSGGRGGPAYMYCVKKAQVFMISFQYLPHIY